MSKKILLINTTYNIGGAAGVARSLFRNIHGDDFTMYFAYGRGKALKDERTFKFGNLAEVAIHALWVRVSGIEGVGSYFSTKKLIAYIQKEKFDLIHLHNIHGYYLNYGMLFSFLSTAGIHVAWTLHDEWPLTWLPAHSMGCIHCKGGDGVCTNSYTYPKTFNRFFSKKFLHRKQKILSSLSVLTIISPATWLTQAVQNSYLHKYFIMTIHNGVDTNIFQPTQDIFDVRLKNNLPQDKKIILFSAANLKDENKGMQYVLDVARVLQDDIYLFVGIGNGELSTSGNIQYTGYIDDQQKLATIYQSAEVFCITSKIETQPLTVLEAFASGLPVVAFDIPATRELVDESSGTVVHFGDVTSLGEAIVSNMADGVQKEKSKHIRDIATTNFSKDMCIKNYTEMYSEILQ